MSWRFGGLPARETLLLQRFVTAAVIWAYMVSIYQYKTWYVAAVLAVVVDVLLIALGGLRYGGWISAVLPVGLYYLWLMTTAIWASHPLVTVWYAAVDAIGIVMAALFYVLTLNQPRRIAGIFITFAWIAVPVTVFILWRSPEASRSGGYAAWVLPFVPAFCWSDVARGRHVKFASIGLILSFAVLIFTRSRTPIAVAVFTTGLTVFALSHNFLTVLRRATITLAVVALSFAGLVYFRSTREIALITWSRFTHQNIKIGGIYVESEPAVDTIRERLHEAARHYAGEFLFFGMGYRNFPYYSAYWHPFGRPMTLHSMYETWLVEGGLVCLAIVALMFYLHFRALIRAVRWSSDPEIRRLARVVLLNSIGIFLFGLFHQMHANPMVYALIGIGAALPRCAPLHRPHRLRPGSSGGESRNDVPVASGTSLRHAVRREERRIARELRNIKRRGAS